MNAGARVRKARLERGLTQSELAGDEYSAAYVSIIESGKREPSERVLRAFARALGVTYDELATGRPPQAEASLEDDLASARRALSAGGGKDAVSDFRRVARRASQYGLEELALRASLGEAFCYETDGDLERALDMYEKLQESVDDDQLALKADAVAGRSRCLRMLGDVPYSIYVLESYRSHLSRSGLADPEALARIHMTLVASYFEGGMLTQAQAAADEALALAPRVADEEKVANMHINVARVLLHRGQHAAAARSFASAERLFRALGLQREVGRAHLARAFLRRDQGRYRDARADIETALEIFEANDDDVNVARAMNALGSLERIEGNFEEAIALLERVRRMPKREPASLAISHRELALCYVAMEQPVKAKTNFKTAVELLEKSRDNYELAITYRAWGDALRESQDFETACKVYRLAAVALEAA